MHIFGETSNDHPKVASLRNKGMLCLGSRSSKGSRSCGKGSIHGRGCSRGTDSSIAGMASTCLGTPHSDVPNVNRAELGDRGRPCSMCLKFTSKRF